MSKIYLALVDTPGIFAFFIRRYLKQNYIHVVLSLDENLEEAYSVGRRNPAIPVFAGMEREDKYQILRAFPTASYKICALECSPAQKEALRQRLKEDWENRFHFHYAVLGLLFLVAKRPFYQKNHFTCSSYLAKVLSECGIAVSSKHFSLVTPKDFRIYMADKKTVFEGPLSALAGGDAKRVEVAYEAG